MSRRSARSARSAPSASEGPVNASQCSARLERALLVRRVGQARDVSCVRAERSLLVACPRASPCSVLLVTRRRPTERRIQPPRARSVALGSLALATRPNASRTSVCLGRPLPAERPTLLRNAKCVKPALLAPVQDTHARPRTVLRVRRLLQTPRIRRTSVSSALLAPFPPEEPRSVCQPHASPARLLRRERCTRLTTAPCVLPVCSRPEALTRLARAQRRASLGLPLPLERQPPTPRAQFAPRAPSPPAVTSRASRRRAHLVMALLMERRRRTNSAKRVSLVGSHLVEAIRARRPSVHPVRGRMNQEPRAAQTSVRSATPVTSPRGDRPCARLRLVPLATRLPRALTSATSSALCAPLVCSQRGGICAVRARHVCARLRVTCRRYIRGRGVYCVR